MTQRYGLTPQELAYLSGIPLERLRDPESLTPEEALHLQAVLELARAAYLGAQNDFA